ncbi:MAG: molybdopterin adenylyltransferase [Verrucomicrobia bacterium]|nr:molybdopterin adenylyltransferase [Verrucomicrobiota bacterium]
MKIGRLTVSDRAAAGEYADRSGPEIERVLRACFGEDNQFLRAVVPDEADQIAAQLRAFADREGCDLIVTTGGTGVAPRDVTPEATLAVLDKELPGFGELMRSESMKRVATAILSRATAGTRGKALIVNLPGKPTAVAECLAVLVEAIREGVEHLGGRDPHQARVAGAALPARTG